MSFITLQEFQHTVGIPDSAMIYLLSHQMVECRVDPTHGLLINAKCATATALIEALANERHTFLSAQIGTLSERLGALVSERLDAILDEAVVLASRQPQIVQE